MRKEVMKKMQKTVRESLIRESRIIIEEYQNTK